MEEESNTVTMTGDYLQEIVKKAVAKPTDKLSKTMEKETKELREDLIEELKGCNGRIDEIATNYVTLYQRICSMKNDLKRIVKGQLSKMEGKLEGIMNAGGKNEEGAGMDSRGERKREEKRQ